MPEQQPDIIVKPQTPFFLDVKFIISTAFLIMVILGLIFFRFALTPKKEQPPKVASQISIKCPIKSSFCKGDNNFKQSSFSAILSTGTPILAVFDGLVENYPKNSNQDHQIISLTNKDLGLQAIYYFSEIISIGPAKVKEGDVIAIVDGESIPQMDNRSFVLHLVDLDQKRQLIPLTTDNFKQ